MQDLFEIAAGVGALLKARKETIAVAESSSGGLLSAALLSVPGASAYFLGGAVVYTARARMRFLDLPRESVAGLRSASEPYAALLAHTVRERFRADWGASETGAAGPTGNPYGDAAGHTCIALAGHDVETIMLETGLRDRAENMHRFARAALELIVQRIA